MTQTAQTPAATDQQDPQEELRAKLDNLIAQGVVLDARIKSLKALKEKKRAEAELILQQLGMTNRYTSVGSVKTGSRRKFVLHDPDKLMELFPPAVLIEQFSATAPFWDAAKKAGIAVEEAITCEESPSFTLKARQTREVRERNQRIQDETRDEMEARIEHLARLMQLHTEADR